MDDIAIFLKERDSEGNFIFDSLTFWIASIPEFQIFRTIVLSIAVFVMNSFMQMKRATENLFHDFAMLCNRFFLTAICAREITIARMVNRSALKLRIILTLDRTISFAFVETKVFPLPKNAASFDGFFTKFANKYWRIFSRFSFWPSKFFKFWHTTTLLYVASISNRRSIACLS